MALCGTGSSAFNGRSLSGYQQKRVWINDGAGKFVDVAQSVGATDTYDGRSVALADLWNRGVLDVVVANQNGPLLIYKNTVTPDNRWIEFELEGTASNRSAIGMPEDETLRGRQQKRCAPLPARQVMFVEDTFLLPPPMSDPYWGCKPWPDDGQVRGRDVISSGCG